MTTQLRIFAFPQHWDGARLELRVLTAPFGNPMQPLQPLQPGLPSFADAQLVLSAKLIGGSMSLPTAATVDEAQRLQIQTPADMSAVYQAFATHFGVDPTAPQPYVAAVNTRFLKMLMPSYRDASGHRQSRTELAVTDNRYVCALADGARPSKRAPKPAVPPKWDAVLAMALRQPVVAEQLGLIHRAFVTPDDQARWSEGGWLYVDLDPESDYFAAAAQPDFLKLYAARLPPLLAGKPRAVFAPVLFPVSAVLPAGSFDEVLQEAETYSDGFARLVHSYQPDRVDYLNLSKQGERRMRLIEDTGLRLGWDDEQIVIWLNRQVVDDPRNGSASARDTPLGVRGYRLDVRDVESNAKWHSLVAMQGSIHIGNLAPLAFDGDMAIELAANQLQGQRDGDYWLPPYFARWTGGSVIAPDPLAFQLGGADRSARTLEPVGATDVPLRYGREYEFRVRLADLTGGGPKAALIDTPEAATARCRFRRYVPPGAPRLSELEAQPDSTLRVFIERPLLGYPALLFTPVSNSESRLIADAPAAFASERMPGYPDPDVARVRIDVRVASLALDPANESGPEPLRALYTTFREFDQNPTQPLELEMAFDDCDDIALFDPGNATGPLRLPTARTLEVTFTSIARRDPGMSDALADPLSAEQLDAVELDRESASLTYFGKQAIRLGGRRAIKVRRESSQENAWLGVADRPPLQGVLLRPAPPADIHLHATNAAAGAREQGPKTAIQRLAAHLDLEQRHMTLSSAPGRRVVFGAAAAVRHILSPEHSTITFADESAITSQWLMVIAVRIQRDWTWDALGDEGLSVMRIIDGGPSERVGSILPRKCISATALRRDVELDRSFTELIFIDAIDPKPQSGAFPRELNVKYEITATLRSEDNPGAGWSGSVTLPIATKPAQVPRIVSAGIALAAYERDAVYSRTAIRHRMLWVEFAEPIADPNDAYFARVTAHAADPMLMRTEPVPPPNPLEAPLDIDDELIRAILPNQPRDVSGLTAMQPLVPADGEHGIRHFLLPLPKAIAEQSPELFGFFVYEFCVGHAKGWSLAQARYGLPQRLTGVQHPAPALTCSVSRNADHVIVTAPFATCAVNGQLIHAEPPTTEIWALLYVQVRIADASDWRNILIGRTRLSFMEESWRGRTGPEPQGRGYWDQYQIVDWLEALGLPHNSPLSTVAVELLPEPDGLFEDPLGKHLGEVRVLRTSPLTPVPQICVDA
jgi:hypothetical protein